jgi:RNAse (barnase) inhibitor barstar
MKKQAEPVTRIYRLTEDESDSAVMTARDIDGFFTRNSEEAGDVKLFDIEGVAKDYPRLLHDIELQILDRHGVNIGGYYIGEVHLQSLHPHRDKGSNSTDAIASFFGYTCPYPDARHFWQVWSHRRPVKAGEWRKYHWSTHASWLHVVQQVWFRTGREARRYGHSERCAIDTRDLVTVASLYCALGEAFNGPGGYFGSNPSALDDCLSGSYGTPLTLDWRGFAEARERLNHDEDIDIVVSIFESHGVRIVYKNS